MSRFMHLPVTATTTLMVVTMNLFTKAFERLGRFDNDEGTTTIEYAMAALAAAALAGVLYVIVTSPTVHDALQGIITNALSNTPSPSCWGTMMVPSPSKPPLPPAP